MDQEHGKKVSNILLEYSNQSTIVGVLYIFSSSQSRFGRLYWTTSTIMLLALGIYWSFKGYQDWRASPVVTTPISTAVSVERVPFPAVIFCPKGFSPLIFVSSFAKVMMDFMEKNLNHTFKYTPYEIAFKNKDWLFQPIFQFVSNKDPDLNILIRPTTFRNKSIEEFLIAGYEFPQKSLSILPAIYTFNFFNQKDVGTYFNASVLDLYLAMTGLPANDNRINYFLDSNLREDLIKFSVPWQKHLDDDFNRVNLSEIFEALFRHLWYSKLPCFDLIGLSAMEDNDSAFVKNCLWKGVAISCAALFKKVPTDQGICCGFNSDMADSIYVDSLFSKTIISLQANDANMSFSPSDLPNWFVQSGEPRSKPGLAMGLQVTLDGHKDLLDAFSIDSPYDSFQIVILPNGDFPMVSQSGVRLQRGCHNLVALSATIIKSDDSLRSITSEDRGCLYPDERPLKLFKKYSQSNCIFECLLTEVQEKVKGILGHERLCYPWYIPFIDEELETCDPKTSNLFDASWKRSNGSCDYCLPDCAINVYKYSLSQEPFRSCDDFNVGISPLCNLMHRSSIYKPFLWGQKVLQQLGSVGVNQLISNGNNYNNIRNISSMFSIGKVPIFDNTRSLYNAYKGDIAIVSVFFQNPTVWMFSTTASSSWISYISNVGGLLGLCIGISFSTIVELIWLLIRFCVEGNFSKKVKRFCQKLDNHEDETIENVDELQVETYDDCDEDLPQEEIEPNETKPSLTDDDIKPGSPITVLDNSGGHDLNFKPDYETDNSELELCEQISE